jgi:thiamine biosynthesis protein ThiS
VVVGIVAMNAELTITVNGQPRPWESGASIATLLETMGLKPDRVAVELNRRLVRASQYETELKSGDQIEIVTFVGGG